METRKQRVIDTLDAWVNQRPGLNPCDYSDGTMEGWRGYRRESASITKDMHDYYAIRNVVQWRDSITADMIVSAFEHAFSGRLTITEEGEKIKLSYCTGQYWPTEYRKAACAVLAAAWWAATRDDCPVEYDPDAPANESPGQWMRNTARQTFGQGVQRGWFG